MPRLPAGLAVSLMPGLGLLGLSPATTAFAQVGDWEVEVIDVADDLNEADEQLLLERTPELELPVEVSDVTYILFP